MEENVVALHGVCEGFSLPYLTLETNTCEDVRKYYNEGKSVFKFNTVEKEIGSYYVKTI